MKIGSRLRVRTRQLRQTLRAYRDLLRKERGLLVAAFVALAVETGMLLLAPWPIQYLFDGLILPTPETSLFLVPDGFPQREPATFVATVCGAVLVIAAVGGVASYYRQVWAATAGQRMVLKLRKRLYGHLQSLSLRFHTDRRLGDLILRITGDIPALRDILSETLLDLIGRVLLAVATIAVMFWLDPVLATVAVITLLVVFASSALFGRRIARVAKRQRAKEGFVAHTAAESLASITLIKALGAEERMLDVFARQNRTSMRQGLRGTRLQAALSRAVEITFAIGIAIVLAWGAWRVAQQGVLTAGTLLVFVSYVRSLNKPLRRLSRASSRIGKASACAERIGEIFAIAPEEVDPPDAVSAPALRGEIHFDRVTFGYDPAQPILRELDLHVAPGERVALVGRNGAGKTSLLHLALRFYEPSSGQIEFDGIPAHHFTIASVRAQIALALQETLLFGSTLRENLRLAVPDATDEAMLAALQTVGGEWIAKLPDGLDTVLAEAGKNFSGGERRKLGLAIALLRRCPILFLDEPTTFIDGESRDDLVAAFDRITEGRTTIVVTHDADLLPRVDRVVLLADGRIVASGPHERLWRECVEYRALFGAASATIESSAPRREERRASSEASPSTPKGASR